MTKLRAISILSVLLVMATFVARYATGQEPNKNYTPRSYRMISTTTWQALDGTTELRNVRTRWVNAEGEWKEVVQPVKPGQSTSMFLSTKQGKFSLDGRENALQFDGEFTAPDPRYRSDKAFRESEQFVREDTILGYKVYLLRAKGGDDNYVDSYVAPEVGHIPVKVVMHGPKGDLIIEAIKIDFLDVKDEMIAKPDLPVKLDNLKKQIEEFEKRGWKEQAEMLRSAMREWQEHNTK